MKFVKVVDGDKGSFAIEKSGKHVFFLHNYSGELSLDIRARDTEVYIFGVYIGKKSDEFNLHTIQHHEVGDSVSDLLIKGVFYDESKLQYEGLIKIDKGAQKSNAYQKNQNLVMSPKVFVDSRPFLEIAANDVRCTHGSTTGKLDKSQLFYLETRGIHHDKAKKVLVEGFMQDVFDKMEEIGVDTKNIKIWQD